MNPEYKECLKFILVIAGCSWVVGMLLGYFVIGPAILNGQNIYRKWMKEASK